MSTDMPPSGDTEPLVDVADEDHEQTLLTIDVPGVDGVLAVEHGADYHRVCDALEDAAKEVKHQTQLRGRNAEFNGGDEE